MVLSQETRSVIDERRVVRFLAVLFILGAGFVVSAHDVFSTKITYSREISRLIYKRCASCHGEGGSSFSLTTFEEARPWAKAIKEEVLERRMPPFGAVKGFGDLRDDRALTQEEIHLIADWVEGGSPEGDPALLPRLVKVDTDGATPLGPELIVDGSITLKQASTFIGVRSRGLLEGSSVKLIAARPNGQITPLIWLYDYNPKFDRTYAFRTPLVFPAGTKIEAYPRDKGALALVEIPTTSAPPPAR
jgi:hypothetical protein